MANSGITTSGHTLLVTLFGHYDDLNELVTDRQHYVGFIGILVRSNKNCICICMCDMIMRPSHLM